LKLNSKSLKTTLITLSFAVTVLLSSAAFSQNFIIVKIDTSFCNNISHLDGEFGLYATTRYGRQVDTLVNSLQFVERQKIILASDSLTNYRLVFTPNIPTISKVVAPLYYFNSLDTAIQLDCYFFRKSISLLDQLENKDTLFITTEYKGESHTGMKFPRSTLRIIKKKNQFYYSRNNLPTNGNLVFPTFPEGKYENGFSEERILTEEQLISIRQFETKIVKSVEYSFENGTSELRITLKDRTFKFIPNRSIRNESAHLIWEKLK
jgi:hypothetical protein